MKISYNEFHVSRKIRDLCSFDKATYASTGNVILADMKSVRIFSEKLNELFDKQNEHEKRISAGQLNAMGLIDEIFHYVCMLYRRNKAANAFTDALGTLEKAYGKENVDKLLLAFISYFPPSEVYQNKLTAEQYLEQTCLDTGTNLKRTNREQTLEELMLLHLANENPAFKPFIILFDDKQLALEPLYQKSWATLQEYFKTLPVFGPFNHDLISLMREPVVFSPESLKGQLEYIRLHWTRMLGEWLNRLLAGLDTIHEEEKASWQPMNGGSPNMVPYNYENLMKEYERFSSDSDWMPKVVLIAKTVLVWLDQLTKKYSRPITRLDQIPDEELDTLRDEGFTGLWLIGLWERSHASRRIKQICGNPEAAASAYSLYDYEIAGNIGGWDALGNLRNRLNLRGIRLASDMVPNHTGMDSKWVTEKPDLFIQRSDCPFPQYSFNGENLSLDSRVSVYIEDHYYSKTDCAVVFKRVDNQTGDVRYIYHGNDGTGMPWNDTAQIDFLNPEAREKVIQEIIKVAKNFPIIRFDAAMVLAKKHIRRLWYPEPGKGGDIATRSETGFSTQQFNNAIPNEFWREVVDRIAKEVPDTLLLAEAFWMMEGYFVRTLGMHRVYNSAFMNMLKKEENQKYRDTIKNTIKFDPQILKRFVNFMNNPDEETAVAQFGKGDKYFGVCTLMVTMPGLPMFGHGQIEGFEEKYGMEYTKAYLSEQPDQELIERHKHDIFPLMKKRYLFAQVENFLFYDVWDSGHINENIFAYSNNAGGECTVVFYNNKYDCASGWIKQSCGYAVKTGSGEQDIQLRSRSISEGLKLNAEDDKYCIFREQRSGLWFVRSSRDICEHGMFIALNGFEVQIYMDIHQIEDLPDHRWKILCETLSGRGCEDLEIEWEEIKYKELYKAFESFALGILPDINAIFHPATAAEKTQKAAAVSIKKLLEKAKPSALAFYKATVSFAKDDGIKLEKPEKQFAAFCTRFKRIAELQTDIANNETLKKGSLVLRKAKDGTSFLRTLIAEEDDAALLLSCWAAVCISAEKGCAKKYSLSRKFTEYAKSIGIAGTSIRNPLTRIFVLSPEINKLSITNIKSAAYTVASLLVEKEDSALLTGKNVFDGIEWFNKELSDSSLTYFTALQLLQTTSAQEAYVLKLYALLADAKLKASYKCELFVKRFAHKKSIKAESSPKIEASKKISIRPSDGKSKEITMATTTAKKPAAKKPAVKTMTAKKTAAKTTTKKTAEKAATKKPAVKKTATKKTVVKKVAAKTTAKKPAVKKAATKKTVVKKVAAKTTAKKPAVKKTATKTAAKKPTKKTVGK